MRTGWRHSFGRVAALLGVLGLLLSGANPTTSRALADQIDAGAASGRATHLTSTTHRHDLHDHGTSAAQAPAKLIDDADRETSSSDCPQHHGRACCTAAACPAFSMALTADPTGSFAWIGATSAFRRYAVTVPAGIDALPVTPPPRRDF